MTANHASYVSKLQAFLHDSSSEAEVAAALAESPEQIAGIQRALRFYAYSARSRRMGFVKNAFPGVLRMLSAENRKTLEEAYMAGSSGTDLDWSRNAVQFLEVVEQLVKNQQLPPAVADVTTHKWTLFELSFSRDRPEPAESVEKMAVNPTFDARQYPRVVTTRRLEPESAGPVLLGYYLHPGTRKPRWLKLDDSVFAMMRVVDEQIPFETAAGESGVDVATLIDRAQSFADAGLFVKRG